MVSLGFPVKCNQ